MSSGDVSGGQIKNYIANQKANKNKHITICQTPSRSDKALDKKGLNYYKLQRN